MLALDKNADIIQHILHLLKNINTLSLTKQAFLNYLFQF